MVPTWTDNQGNGAALNRLTSTRFLACAVLMELASYMRRMAMKVQVEWSHRTRNTEADELATGDFHSFDPQLRVPEDHLSLVWDILPQARRSAERDSQVAKASGVLPNRGRKQRKRKPEERLRIADPW